MTKWTGARASCTRYTKHIFSPKNASSINSFLRKEYHSHSFLSFSGLSAKSLHLRQRSQIFSILPKRQFLATSLRSKKENISRAKKIRTTDANTSLASRQKD